MNKVDSWRLSDFAYPNETFYKKETDVMWQTNTNYYAEDYQNFNNIKRINVLFYLDK